MRFVFWQSSTHDVTRGVPPVGTGHCPRQLEWPDRRALAHRLKLFLTFFHPVCALWSSLTFSQTEDDGWWANEIYFQNICSSSSYCWSPACNHLGLLQVGFDLRTLYAVCIHTISISCAYIWMRGDDLGFHLVMLGFLFFSSSRCYRHLIPDE